MTAMCPHCGFDLIKSEPIITDGFTLFPDGRVLLNDVLVNITPQQGQLLYTVAKADGRPVLVRVIGERISDVEDPYNLVQVILTQLRAKFRADGNHLPVTNVRGFGLIWTAMLTDTQQRIVDYLKAATDYTSAKQIGRDLNLGLGVEMHVHELRRRGIPVTTKPGGNGYRLT